MCILLSRPICFAFQLSLIYDGKCIGSIRAPNSSNSFD